jgi:hypothetical protein
MALYLGTGEIFYKCLTVCILNTAYTCIKSHFLSAMISLTYKIRELSRHLRYFKSNTSSTRWQQVFYLNSSLGIASSVIFQFANIPVLNELPVLESNDTQIKRLMSTQTSNDIFLLVKILRLIVTTSSRSIVVGLHTKGSITCIQGPTVSLSSKE